MSKKSIKNILHVGSEHITDNDDILLGVHTSTLVNISAYPLGTNGHFIYIDQKLTGKLLLKEGLSPAFAKIYLKALKENCEYLLIDELGEFLEGFETF